MLNIEKIEDITQLDALKAAYFEQSTAPLDGMWHFGFVPAAEHYGFYDGKTLVGYCCVNDDGYLLQFYLPPAGQTSARALFRLITEQHSPVIGEVKGGFVSTAEPGYLSLCLDHGASFKVNALMYQYAATAQQAEAVDMTLASEAQLSQYVRFAAMNIGAPEDWLNSYYGNLIERSELLGYWQEGRLLAAGECRLFDQFQTGYADLGMIVAQSIRGQGMAKKVLVSLSKHAAGKGLRPMCSTESDNIAAQKAIVSAGFVSANRIVQFEFSPSS